MFILTDTTSIGFGRTSVVETFDTFEAAITYVRKTLKIVLLTIDPDYDGCADLFTTNGNLYTIQPEGFTLTA